MRWLRSKFSSIFSAFGSDVAVAAVDSAAAPQIGVDLMLHPKALETAFWQEQASKYAPWDSQVAWFFAVLMIGFTAHRVVDSGFVHAWDVFGPAITNLSLWLLALRCPSFYLKHRVPLLFCVKVFLALQTLHATNQVRDKLYLTKRLTHQEPEVALFLKMVLISNVPYFPAWVACLALPMRVQVLFTTLSAAMLFLGGCTQELVTYGNTPEYLRSLDASNAMWSLVVQSGDPAVSMLLQQSVNPTLLQRSASMTIALLTIYFSTVSCTLYLTYMLHWAELRQWLRTKAHTATTARHTRAAAPVYINGVELSRGQLLQMCQSSAAQLLLDGVGVLGRVSMALLHLAIVQVLCLASLLLSQFLVLHLAPRLWPPPLLTVYYPLRPEVEQGMCHPDEAPQFVGWLGWLLHVLG